MKRVGIVSLYYRNVNYGGLLQSYALQQVIESLGYDAKQISYDLSSGNHPSREVINELRRIYHKVRRWKWEFGYFKQSLKIRKFERMIPHTKRITRATIYRVNDLFDLFVCGSDQIWNPVGWQPTFFLDFVQDRKRKIAYAASIARDSLSTNELKYIKSQIEDFSAVSVREEISVSYLKDYCPNVERMPDPTLLLTQKEWDLITAERSIDEPYVFAYFLGDNPDNLEKAKRFAKDRGLKIVFIPYLNVANRFWEAQNKECLRECVGVNDFLSLIKNSEFVLTDSYHGAVFSIVFEKPFFVLMRFGKKDAFSMNSRIDTLLSDFSLSNRVVNELVDMYMGEIDWAQVQRKKEILEEKGKSFLIHNLG